MFTGIVEEVGVIDRVWVEGMGKRVLIKSNFENLIEGESISIDGVCLTVEKIEGDKFQVYMSEETLMRTKFGFYLKPRQKVNLERAMKLGGRFGGHFITGHVDTVGKILKIIPRGGEVEWEVEVKEGLRYVVEKGSIAIDGVSLTVNKILSSKIFSLKLVPYTLTHTNFINRKIGDLVNIEFDILGKYIYEFISQIKKFR